MWRTRNTMWFQCPRCVFLHLTLRLWSYIFRSFFLSFSFLSYSLSKIYVLQSTPKWNMPTCRKKCIPTNLQTIPSYRKSESLTDFEYHSSLALLILVQIFLQRCAQQDFFGGVTRWNLLCAKSQNYIYKKEGENINIIISLYNHYQLLCS